MILKAPKYEFSFRGCRKRGLVCTLRNAVELSAKMIQINNVPHIVSLLEMHEARAASGAAERWELGERENLPVLGP